MDSTSVYWRKVGTKAYERPLLGLIGMAARVSVNTLAQATNTNRETVLRQLYWWAYNGKNIKLLHRVNWRWNRAQEIPERFIRLFNKQPLNPEQRFVRTVVRELHKQTEEPTGTEKVQLLAKLLMLYADQQESA
jgi:hypothetical protein